MSSSHDLYVDDRIYAGQCSSHKNPAEYSRDVYEEQITGPHPVTNRPQCEYLSWFPMSPKSLLCRAWITKGQTAQPVCHPSLPTALSCHLVRV